MCEARLQRGDPDYIGVRPPPNAEVKEHDRHSFLRAGNRRSVGDCWSGSTVPRLPCGPGRTQRGSLVGSMLASSRCMWAQSRQRLCPTRVPPQRFKPHRTKSSSRPPMTSAMKARWRLRSTGYQLPSWPLAVTHSPSFAGSLKRSAPTPSSSEHRPRQVTG